MAIAKVGKSTKRDWTVLVYQGNGCRGKFHTHQFDRWELGELAPSDRVTFAVQGHTDYKENTLGRWLPEKSDLWAPLDPLTTVEGRQTNPNKLSQFIEWGIREYPAENYCLVLSGYAGGWNGMMADKKEGLMSLEDIRKGLEDGLAESGEKLGVLALDGHWMASAEVATEFSECAEHLVASRGRMESWKYQDSFAGLVKEEMKPPELAAYLVRADQGQSDMTWLDLSKAHKFLKKSKTFCQKVMESDWDRTLLAAGMLNDHFIDMEKLMVNSQGEGVPKPVQRAGARLGAALAGMVVMQRGTGGEYPTETVNVASHPDRRNKNQTFHKKTGWGEMVSTLGHFQAG